MSASVLLPSASTTLVILLGASAWPYAPGFSASKAFKHAIDEFREYLLDLRSFGLPKENLCDLFDKEISSSDQLEMLALFLERRTQALKSENQAVRDIVVYFVGHGGFVGQSADFYFLLRRSNTNRLRASGMSIDALAEVLLEKTLQTRRYLFLDCCFAAAAFSSFQGGPDQAAIMKTLEAFSVPAKGRGIPRKGTVLLCSSDHKTPSLLLPDESSTMFSSALLDVLKEGDSQRPLYLSLRDLRDLTHDRLVAFPARNAPRPSLHSPDQSDGDVAEVPFFPNVQQQNVQQTQDIPVETLVNLLSSMTESLFMLSPRQGTNQSNMRHSISLHAQTISNEIVIQLGFSKPTLGGALDVLREPTQQLRGSITAKRNQTGGVDYQLRFPRTQGIIQGLLVQAGGLELVIPLLHINS